MIKDTTKIPHEVNTRYRSDLLTMRSVYKSEGYGWYWIIVELLRVQPGYKLSMHGLYVWSALALELQSDPETIEKFIKDCIEEFKLFESDGEFFWSPDLTEKVKTKTEKARSAASARWRSENVTKGIQTHFTYDEEKIQPHTREMQTYPKEMQPHTNEMQMHSSEMQTHPKEMQMHTNEMQTHSKEMQSHSECIKTSNDGGSTETTSPAPSYPGSYIYNTYIDNIDLKDQDLKDLKDRDLKDIYTSKSKNKRDPGQLKKHYADYVTLTEEEYKKLVAQFGEAGAKDRIESLNLWKGSKGKRTASDYLTILNWARREEKERGKAPTNFKSSSKLATDEFKGIDFSKFTFKRST